MMPLQAFCLFRSERNSFLAFSLFVLLFCISLSFNGITSQYDSVCPWKLFFSSCFFPLLSLLFVKPQFELTKFFIFWSSVSITTSFKMKDEKNKSRNTIIEGIHVFEMNELINTSRLLIPRNHYDAETLRRSYCLLPEPTHQKYFYLCWAKKRGKYFYLVS